MGVGETNLRQLLATLDVERRPGTYTFVVDGPPEMDIVAQAVVDESEGRTLVVPVDAALRSGLDVVFEAVWLTLTVHSSLEAVGLTAAFSVALADAGIACNVLAGYHHDHLLVPADRADDAVAVLRALSSPVE